MKMLIGILVPCCVSPPLCFLSPPQYTHTPHTHTHTHTPHTHTHTHTPHTHTHTHTVHPSSMTCIYRVGLNKASVITALFTWVFSKGKFSFNLDIELKQPHAHTSC